MAGTGNWWIVNRPTGGVGSRGVMATNYVVEESITRPPNTVAGPFASPGAATAWQSSANSAGNSPGSAIGAAVDAGTSALNPLSGLSDLAHRLTEAQTWVRVGEVIAGLILLYVGLKSEFPTTVNTIMAPVRDTARGTFNAAKLGLI